MSNNVSPELREVATRLRRWIDDIDDESIEPGGWLYRAEDADLVSPLWDDLRNLLNRGGYSTVLSLRGNIDRRLEHLRVFQERSDNSKKYFWHLAKLVRQTIAELGADSKVSEFELSSHESTSSWTWVGMGAVDQERMALRISLSEEQMSTSKLPLNNSEYGPEFRRTLMFNGAITWADVHHDLMSRATDRANDDIRRAKLESVIELRIDLLERALVDYELFGVVEKWSVPIPGQEDPLDATYVRRNRGRRPGFSDQWKESVRKHFKATVETMVEGLEITRTGAVQLLLDHLAKVMLVDEERLPTESTIRRWIGWKR